MDKATREKKELLINHLVAERDKIEDACGGRPHDDIKKVYSMISNTIAELKVELFMMEYSDYEENLNELLGIGRSSK
jgi:hypothetical protein